MRIVLNLELIRGRCTEVGECWLWNQGCTSNGIPIARDDGRMVIVRRRVWELKNNEKARHGYFVVASCAQKLCVAPGCALQFNSKQFVRWSNSNGFINNAAQSARRVARMRAAYATLDAEGAALIRERVLAGDSRSQVAKDHDISYAQVGKIARGENWRPQSMSVFHLAA